MNRYNKISDIYDMFLTLNSIHFFSAISLSLQLIIYYDDELNLKCVILLFNHDCGMQKLSIHEIIYLDIMYYSMTQRLRVFSHGNTPINNMYITVTFNACKYLEMDPIEASYNKS